MSYIAQYCCLWCDPFSFTDYVTGCWC